MLRLSGPIAAVLIVLFAVRAPAAGADEGTEQDGTVLLHTEAARDVTARFWGHSPADPGTPDRYGVSRLTFTFDGDPTPYGFEPEGTLYFSDWRFGIFSPDGRYVLLLQDRFGPYHLVSTERLRDYLNGEAAPDHVLRWQEEGSAAVHADARWRGARDGSFRVECCGTARTIRFEITGGTVRLEPLAPPDQE